VVPKELSYRQVLVGVGALVVGDPGNANNSHNIIRY
jgi:hypothetical protein